MNREQFSEMLKEIKAVRDAGGNVHACVESFKNRYKYVYFYNDRVFKYIMGNPENRRITASFLNAILKLDGSDCIGDLVMVNPAIVAPLGKDSVSDLVAETPLRDRIVVEVQLKGDESYSERLVFYVAKHVASGLFHGETQSLSKLDLISLQMFSTFPKSGNYRHCIQLKNQDNDVFYKKLTLTLVEIPKFLSGFYDADDSRLACWLRVIDGINNEITVPVDAGSPYAYLQEKAKLSIFTEEFLVHEAISMSDRAYELFVEKKEARAEGLEEGRAEGRAKGLEEGRAEGRTEGANEKAREMARGLRDDGVPMDIIVRRSGLSEETIRSL